MGAIDLLQGVGSSLYLFTVTVVGVRLLMLARRNRTLPEVLLGLGFFCGGTLGATLEAGASAAYQQISAQAAGAATLAGKLFGLVGMTAYQLFIWRVFRPRSRAAGALVGLLVASSVVALVGSASAGTFSTGKPAMPWFWIEFLARFASPLWLVFEAARYHGLMKKRVRLGLANPLVADRFFLWALGGSISLVLLLTSVPPVVSDTGSIWMQLNVVIFGFSGVATSVPYWLAFFPPRAYRQRVLRRAEARG